MKSVDSPRLLGRTSRRRLMPGLIVAALLTVALVHGATAQEPAVILYVDAGATGAGDGTSWADAYVHLQDALDQVNAAADPALEIWVAAGIYYPDVDADGDHVPGSRAESFTLARDGVSLYGGFDPGAGVTAFDQRDPAAHPAVLSGDVDRNDVNDDGNGIADTWADVQGANAYHVLYLDGRNPHPIMRATVVDGLIITAGQGDGSYPQDRGGGLYCRGGRTAEPEAKDEGVCSPLLSGVVVSGNQAVDGGGMYHEGAFGGDSSPTLERVIVTGNRASHWGGGIYNDALSGSSSPVLVGVTVDNNEAGWGGGMATAATYSGTGSPIVRDTTFENNHANPLFGTGGGMYCYGDLSGTSSPRLTRVTFRANSAGSGGGMHSHGYSATSSPVLLDVLFERNQAAVGGGLTIASSHGGEAYPVLIGVRFQGNRADYHGGGMANTSGGGTTEATLVNVLFSGNHAGGDGGGLVNEASPATTRATLANVTFSGNVAGGSGGGVANHRSPEALPYVEAMLTNVILWGNEAGTDGAQIYDSGGTPTVTRSLVQGGFPAGTDILDADPLFVRNPGPGTDATWGTGDDDYGDLHLHLTSPAVNAGDNGALPADTYDLDGDGDTAEPVPVDLGGSARFVGPVDMGAYETASTDLGAFRTYLPFVSRR